MPTRAEQQRDYDAVIAAAAAGGVIAASGEDEDEGAEVKSGRAGTVIGAAVAALRRRTQRGAEWIVRAIRPEFTPQQVSTDELREAAEVEVERDAEFYRRMEQRMRRDIPKAMGQDDHEAAVRRVLERERRFTEAHHEAAAARVQAVARRGMVKRLSPEGGYWHLSEAVVEHTPDCLAMAAVGWWPWSVLDRIHPPTHTGCRCELLTHREAYDLGLMSEVAPDTERAEQHAERIAERYGLLQEALLAVRVADLADVASREVPANGPVLTVRSLGGSQARNGEADRVLDMEEVAWDERYARGTVWGGRFKPRRGGFAPRISLNDVLRFMMGTDAPKFSARGDQPQAARVQATPGEPPAGKQVGPQTPPTTDRVAPVPFAGSSGGRRGALPQDFDELADTVREFAQQVGEQHGRPVVLGSININEQDEDTGGYRTWAGDVQVGSAADRNLKLAADKQAANERLDDDTAGGVYMAHRVTVHEASHAINPITPELNAEPEHFALDEALTEEMAHEGAVELLKRQGSHDVLRWLGRNPDDYRARGTYLPQRGALGLILDEAHVPLEDRRELLHNMAFSAPPEDRFKILGGLIAEAQGVTPEQGDARARELLASSAHMDALGEGGEILRQPNFTDYRMRIRAGARVRVTGREEPWEGVVQDATYGEDGRWYAAVEVKLRDQHGQVVDTVTRYPDPDDTEHLADPPRKTLKGPNITGPVAEQDVVRIKQNNGDILVGEVRKVEDDDALGWKAEVLTSGLEMVLVRESSVLDVSRARPGTEPRKRDRGEAEAEGEEAPSGPAEPPTGAQAQRDKVVSRVASQAHEQWRKDRDYAPSPKPHGDATIDIADMTYEELPERWQAENRDGAASAYDAIIRMRDEEGALDVERLASEVHDKWMERNPDGPKELMVPYADLPEEERAKDRVFVERTMKAMGIAEPTAQVLDIEPGSFDPANYSDPRRALITKVRALERGDSLQASDGSTITRGKREDSVLIERPDGSKRRYATVNRMSSAESHGIAARSGVGLPGQKSPSLARDDTQAALAASGQPSPAERPVTEDDVAKGLRVVDTEGRAGRITSFQSAAPEYVKVKFDGEAGVEELHTSNLVHEGGPATPPDELPSLDALTPGLRQAVQDELTKSMLSGWVEPGDDTADLEALIHDAMEQHAADDPDRTPAERRALDAGLVRAAVERAGGQASPGLPEGFVRTSVTAGARPLEGTPIDVGDDVDRAAQLLAEGHRVNLHQPRSVSTLLGKLADVLREAEESGETPPTFDLCKVSVKGTNLFCADTKGVERVKMPQLKGIPLPGGRADRELRKSKKGKVDLADLFRQHLEDMGVDIHDDRVKASSLRASQRQLDAGKVVAKKADLLGGKKGKKKASGEKPIKDLDPIFVSHDDYIVDGHHRWATAVAIDVGDGKLDDVDMDVMRVEMDIIELLDEANRFADEWGVTPGGIGPGSGQASPGQDEPEDDTVLRSGQATPGPFKDAAQNERIAKRVALAELRAEKARADAEALLKIAKPMNPPKFVFRTENADKAYKGQALYGDGFYLAMNEEDARNIQVDPHADVDAPEHIVPPDRWEVDPNLKLLDMPEEELDGVLAPRGQVGNPGRLDGNDLRRAVMAAGYDGIRLESDNPNFGGDQLVLYNPGETNRGQPSPGQWNPEIDEAVKAGQASPAEIKPRAESTHFQALEAEIDGEVVGTLTYSNYRYPPRRKTSAPVRADIGIDKIEIDEAHRRKGIATQLMRELEKANPGKIIDHGYRLDDGFNWSQSYYGHQARYTRDGEPVGDEIADSLQMRAMPEGQAKLVAQERALWAQTAQGRALTGQASPALFDYMLGRDRDAPTVRPVRAGDSVQTPNGPQLVTEVDADTVFTVDGQQLSREQAGPPVMRGRVFGHAEEEHPVPGGQASPTYAPDPDAPEEGEPIMEPDPTGTYPDGIAAGWRQAHEPLVREALFSWKGWPSDMRIHMADALAGREQPGSGNGKRMRAQAEALLWEIQNNPSTNDTALYRGTHADPEGLTAWSDRERVAKNWAARHNFGRDRGQRMALPAAEREGEGRVWTLPPGEARGLRIADYITSGIDHNEREWIIDSTQSGEPVAGEVPPPLGQASPALSPGAADAFYAGEWADGRDIYDGRMGEAVDEWAASLTDTERRATENYTMVAHPSGGPRTEGEPTWDDLQSAATKGKVPQATTVHRAIAAGYGGDSEAEPEALGALGEGDVYANEDRLISTSTDPMVAEEDFGENLAFGGEDIAVLHLTLPEGAPAAFPSVTTEDFAHQQEVLLPSGYEFTVTDTRKATAEGGGTIHHVSAVAVTYPREGQASPGEIRGVIGTPGKGQASPEVPPTNAGHHARDLYRKLRAANANGTLEELAKGGNFPAHDRTPEADLQLVIDGQKPATMLGLGTWNGLKDEVELPEGITAREDDYMQAALIGQPEYMDLLDAGFYGQPRDAWRHVLNGVALGYSDADIAAFLWRRDDPDFFDWGPGPGAASSGGEVAPQRPRLTESGGQASPAQPLRGEELEAELNANAPDFGPRQWDAAELYFMDSGVFQEREVTPDMVVWDDYNQKDRKLLPLVRMLKKMMQPLPRDVEVWRGGAEEKERGPFVSTSTRKKAAAYFGEPQKVVVPAGTRVVWLGGLSEGEYELLIDRESLEAQGGQASPGEPPTESTWKWQRQDDGSYLAENGWAVRKVHRKGRAQVHAFERTPAETKAGDHYEIIRPDGTPAFDSAGTLKAAKLQAERRAFFDQSKGQASPPELPGMKSFLAKMQASWEKGKPERTPERARSEMEAPPEPVQGIPDYSDTELKDVKAAGGSNGARIQTDAEGRKWLVKTYRGDKDRVATELLANALYRELGIAVPNAGFTEVDVPKHGKTRSLTYPLIDGEERSWSHADESLAEGFVADALLANWDVVGLSQDNVLWNKDTPIRLDQGGTLEFRAMGGGKPFGPVPTELWTMARPGGQAFGRMALTDDGMRAAAKDAELRLTPERIDALVDAAPFEDEEMRERVRENLKERVAWLGRYSRGEEEIPEPISGEDVVDEFSARDAALETYPEEDAALEHYLTEQGRNEVDAHLRSGAKKDDASPETQGTVQQMDALLGDKVTRMDEDFYVYIPIPEDSSITAENAGDLQGKWMTEKSYLNAETQYAPTPGAVVMRLTVPPGANALMPSVLEQLEDPTPGRVVLPRRSSILITGTKVVDGATVVDAVVKPG